MPRLGTILARATALNDANITPAADRLRGRSEWDAERIVTLGCQCLRDVAQQLGDRRREVAGIGITGQQHGCVVVDSESRPLTPLINWQDKRGHDLMPGTSRSYLDVARERLGDKTPPRTGCQLFPGFSGLTLFWLKENGLLPTGGRACLHHGAFRRSAGGLCSDHRAFVRREQRGAQRTNAELGCGRDPGSRIAAGTLS